MATGSIGYTPGSYYARFRTRLSAFDDAERWRQKRSEQTQSFIQTNAVLADAFGSAFVTQMQGMATLAAQAAQKRIRAAAVALRNRVDKLA